MTGKAQILQRHSRPLTWGLLCIALCAGRPALAEVYTVCSLTITTEQEIGEFRRHLDPAQFEFVELTPADHQASRLKPWFPEACRRGVQCDVVVISAEFAGSYFRDGGLSLPLRELEELSCGETCGGILHRPLEVFLFACNSLATKGADERTPEEYLQVLLDHGFERSRAERVVAARYGELGDSFCEITRRTFPGVPLIYGFDSRAPSGQNVRPLVSAYLRKVGDYAAHLRAIEAAREAPQSPPRNALIEEVFRNTDFRQTTGVRPAEPAFRKREVACALYDENLGIEERLEIVREVMEGPDFLAFLPNIEIFLSRHPPDEFDGPAREAFARLTSIPGAREQIMTLLDREHSSLLRLELAQFATQMSWIDSATFHEMARSGVLDLLDRPVITFESRELICGIARIADLSPDISANDLKPGHYADPHGIMAIDCLGLKNPQVIDGLAGALESPDVVTRAWAIYALSRQEVAEAAHVEALARRLHDPDAEVRWLAEQTLRHLQPRDEDAIEAIRRVAPEFEIDWLPPPPKRGWFGR
jgi:hypothetical protein